MARFWLGPWQWNAVEGDGFWSAPAQALASLDLRSIPDCAARTTPSGFGLFVTANGVDLGSDYNNLGTQWDASLTNQQRNRIASALLLPETPAATTLDALIWEALTIQADPIGDDRAKPIVPTTLRELELWFAGQRVRTKRFRFDDPEATPVQDLLRRAYRAHRLDSLEGRAPANLYKKILGFWVRKFGLSYRWFQPTDVPDEEPLEPETTFSESFNTSNGDTLGPDLTWTEVDGDWDIVSNAAELISNFGSTARSARADSDLSSVDHYADVSLLQADNGTHPGPCARFSSSANTFYAATWNGHNFAGTHTLYKCVTGTLTSLGTSSQAYTLPMQLRCEANGSTIRQLLAVSTEKISVTDTSITTGTRCGIHGYDPTGSGTSSPRIDSFSCADLGGGGGGGNAAWLVNRTHTTTILAGAM